MRWDAIFISVTNTDGNFIAVNDAQCSLMQREKGGIIGHPWSEWISEYDRPRLKLAFDKSLEGHSVSTKCCVLGDRGLRTAVLAQIFSFGFNGNRNVVSVSQPLYEMDQLIESDSLPVADYILSMSEELSAMAVRSGLRRLGALLNEVAREAEQVAALTGKPLRVES